MKRFVLIIFVLILFTGCFKKNSEKEITTIIENNKNILIGINYPITQNKKLDYMIKKDIENTYNSFKNKYGNFYSLNEKVELNIDYDFNKINNYYIIAIHNYINDSNLKEKKEYTNTYVYDTKKNKKLSLNDILDKDDMKYVSKINKNKCHSKANNFIFDQNYLHLYSSNNCNFKIPFEDLNIKIDIYQKTIKTVNTKIKVPTKIFDPSKKFIALTFDDGPSIYTKKIIDILKKNNCNATFFVLGNKVEIYQDVLKESLKNGNEIGNHSYSHKWLIKLNKNELEKQIYKTQEIIKKTTGYTPTLLRPTYGSVNNNIKKLTDFKITLWNVDTLDWKYKSVNRIVNRAVKNPKDGNIILMHDIHERTVKAVEKIIPMLKEDGYDLVTVSELRDIQVLRDKMKTNQ